MQLESDGSGSTLNINVLTSIQGQRRPAVLLRPPGDQSRDRQRCGSLPRCQKANLTLDGTGTISLGQMATFTVATASLGWHRRV